MILNPHDHILIEATQALGGKLWLMSLNGKGEYCNPSVENIAKEVFLAIYTMFGKLYGGRTTGLRLDSITIYETPNCYTKATMDSVPDSEYDNFMAARKAQLLEYVTEKGIVEYDDRICSTN